MTETTALEQSRAFGFLSEEEVRFLHKLPTLIERENPVAINIGAGVGTSGLALLESRPDLTLFTIDIEGGISPLGGLGNEKYLFDNAGVPESRYRHIIGDSAEAGRYWGDPDPTDEPKADIVFIDGGHLFAQALADIEAWLPRIRDGGIMALHDYVPEEGARWPGVREAVQQGLAGFPFIDTVGTITAYRITYRRD